MMASDLSSAFSTAPVPDREENIETDHINLLHKAFEPP